MRSLLTLGATEEVGDDTVSPAANPLLNNDVIDSAADSLEPGIKPPGGMGGGGGGEGELPLAVRVVAVSEARCIIVGCCTVNAAYFPAEKQKGI